MAMPKQLRLNPNQEYTVYIDCPICGQKTTYRVNSKRTRMTLCADCYDKVWRHREDWAIAYPYLEETDISDFAMLVFLAKLNGKEWQLPQIFSQGQKRYDELQREKERCTRERRRCKERYERDYAI